MLKLSTEHFARIVAQGREGKPLEICGLLAGARDADASGDLQVLEVYEIESDDKSPLTYTINAQGYMNAERDARARDMKIIGIYHTHPATEPYPSKTDVARAHWGDSDDLLFPDYSYLIVSLRDVENPEARSFKIRGRGIPTDVEEETVVVAG